MARPYQQHGLHTLKGRLKVAGLAALDGRSQAARALVAWRREVELDLGGAAAISAMQRAVIDAAATTRLLLDSLDRYLLECTGLVNKRRRSVYPVVLQRQQLADALARYMAQLGLERRRGEVKSLEAHLRERYGDRTESSHDERSADQQGEGLADPAGGPPDAHVGDEAAPGAPAETPFPFIP